MITADNGGVAADLEGASFRQGPTHAEGGVFRSPPNSAKFGQVQRNLAMRALIVSLLVLSASPALAQSPTPSREALTLAGRVARAAQPQLEQGLQRIVEGLTGGYRATAAKTGETINEKALADVGSSELAAAKPLLWDGMAKVYADTYSLDELKALDTYYYTHPGDSAGLPAALAAKNATLQQHEQALVGQLGPEIMQDFFGDYCSRTKCSNEVRKAAGLPVRGN
jgi:hypothetical protein